MKIFNFELESNAKLDLRSFVKFDGECDGDGPESIKLYLDSLIALIDPNKPKMKILNFDLRTKLGLNFVVEFHGECDGDNGSYAQTRDSLS